MGPSNGGITIKDALDLINGSGRENRERGIANLKIIFEHNLHSSMLDALKDGAYHKIFEALFQVSAVEKQTYLSAKSSTGRTRAESLLSGCANALRLIVRAGARKLKPKTVKAVIEHVTQLLPGPDGEYCTALNDIYIRVLAAVLEHEPHIENLQANVWFDTLEFCTAGIKTYHAHAGDVDISSLSSGPSNPVASAYSGTSKMSTRVSKGQIANNSVTRKNVTELLECLLSLVSAPNAPILEKAEELFRTVMMFLNSQNSVTRSHQTAFSILNFVIGAVVEDNVSLCQNIAGNLLGIVARLWSLRDVAKDEMLNSVRDEMLISLISVDMHLSRLVIDDQGAQLYTEIETLEAILHSEYSRRLDRDQLQLDDIEMPSFGGQTTTPLDSMVVGIFCIREYSPRIERNWAILHVLAILRRLLHASTQCALDPHDSGELENDQRPHKRRRLRAQQQSNHLAERIKIIDIGDRLCALQTLLFSVSEYDFSEEDLVDLLDTLEFCISDKRASIASWALLGIAACTQQPMARFEQSSYDWNRVWHNVARLVTNINTCRAATFLLHTILAERLVMYGDISEAADAMLTVTLISAPSLLCDASLSLMAHLLHAQNMEIPGESFTTSQHVIRWLSTKWNPVDKAFATHCGTSFYTIDIVNLLRVCLGLVKMGLPALNNRPRGYIGQAWLRQYHQKDALRYLLLVEDNAPIQKLCPSCPLVRQLHSYHESLESSTSQTSGKRLIIELFLPIFESLLQDWTLHYMQQPSQLTTDALRSAISASILGSLILPLIKDAAIPQSDMFRNILQQLVNAIFPVLNLCAEVPLLAETVLQEIEPYLPSSNPNELANLSDQNPKLLNAFCVFAGFFEQYRGPFFGLEPMGTDDSSDLDDMFPTQQSQPSRRAPSKLLYRENIVTISSEVTFKAVTGARLAFLLEVSVADANKAGSSVSTFLDRILDHSDEQILLYRPLLRNIFQRGFNVHPKTSEAVIRRIGRIVGNPQYDTSEVALGLCLELMTGLVQSWASGENTVLKDPILDLYEWFIEVVIPKRRPSADVQRCLASLLFELMRLKFAPEKERALPSVRSSLLEVLHSGALSVKFHIANHLPTLFELFVLKLHDTVLADVLESLPSDPGWIEGIAFRLFALGKLASRWPTLLRPCTYYIVEVPGSLHEATKHAMRCISDISAALGLESSKDLFRLFSSQLLYTWLEVDAINKLPYAIFGYSNLRELTEDCASEAVALMTMRSQDSYMSSITEILDTSMESLLQAAFSKTLAYSIAHDISIPRSTRITHVSGEKRLKKTFRGEKFYEMVNQQFADILAIFHNTIDQNENLELSLVKEPEMISAVTIINDMKSFGTSMVTLPPSQQPTFKAKYLFAEIDHLCRLTKHEIGNLYTPAMVTFIARRLLSTIQPALGSLHACSILRKLRVLLAFSGSAAVEGYPLEMLLQSIRPYMTDSECADDAFGLTQYLLTRGYHYLSTTPMFFAGITLSIFASLKVFLESSPVSTTQDSQHRFTFAKARDFHGWLGSYTAKYKSSRLNGQSETTFRMMLQSIQAFEGTGNAELGTPESSLLLELIRDQRPGQHFLSKSARDLVFSLLYSDFRCPLSFRTDILGADDDAVEFGAAVWALCTSTSAKGQFLVWAAKVIGRAFVSTGHIDRQMLQESDLCRILKSAAKPSSTDENSKYSIIRLIKSLTLNEESDISGLAETALRLIVAKIGVASDTVVEVAGYEEVLTEHLFQASVWAPYLVPPSDISSLLITCSSDPFAPDAIKRAHWLQDLTASLAQSVPFDPVLSNLPRLLWNRRNFAEEAFPFILHLLLYFHLDISQAPKQRFSEALRTWLNSEDDTAKDHLKVLINAILYLRTQGMPHEKSTADRIHWLELDFTQAARAAIRCSMFKTALLFLEISFSESNRVSTRRSSLSRSPEPTDLMLSIFRKIDDPDMFYGLQQDPNLHNILARLEHESDGSKGLAFRSAQLDCNLRRHDNAADRDVRALTNTLGALSLDGISHSLFKSQRFGGMKVGSSRSMFDAARKLEQWDLPVSSETSSDTAMVYKTFQAIFNAADRGSITQALSNSLQSTMSSLAHPSKCASMVHSHVQTLAVIAEMDEVLGTSNSEQFEDIILKYQNRHPWMKTGRFEDVKQIISCRETMLSCLSQQPRLRTITNISSADARLVEVQSTLLSSSLSRSHGALQESLKAATYLTSLVGPCRNLGLNVEAAVQLEVALALWGQGEMSSSIGILQSIYDNVISNKQTLPIGRPDLLARLGYQISSARLEKPDRIIENYLMPALKELRGQATGKEAGHVFHEFAVFCDLQLQDTNNIQDLERLKKLKEMKESEVQDLGRMVKKATSSEQKAKYHSAFRKAQQWLQLDNEEYRRQVSSRDSLLRQSLQNYLQSLAASDEHNNDALRFSALWLEHSEEDVANDAVSKHLSDVPSRKFAGLMNQLTSRLLDNSSSFQKLLFSLVLQICSDHPYHGMYQIWAGSRSKRSASDETAVSRVNATIKVGHRLASQAQSSTVWSAISIVSKVYCQLAIERNESRYTAGQKISLSNSAAGTQLNALFSKYSIPPPTMKIDIALDFDYAHIPMVHRLDPHITIASGVSAPKIITAISSNGAKYKQLVKGGNDDLRQDAIMEQVFAQVSELLKSNTSTRQRNLGIRTYKVLPLSAHAGIIEFIPNTIPLHDYLMPAHARYYPKDLSSQQCRKQISDVMTQKLETRVKVYRSITERFHPILRYFFMEKFYEPDEWFTKRLAYVRSTAAISMLGHVLGLGDRHGHNILLDDKTGEVVHIDLGVAFEMGRVLPVPELVPFRLTRDIVDGMGITKTEGVYRRCCEFTLEALRKESYSIMAILDVLRYDPLYSWSISPVRLAKLKDAQSAAPPAHSTADDEEVRVKARAVINEPSEADRALTVVSKKLSKALSVTATVNDLINQATDERNLAVLYSGWAAYA